MILVRYTEAENILMGELEGIQNLRKVLENPYFKPKIPFRETS